MPNQHHPSEAGDLILSMPFTVTSAETDMYGRAKLSALINLLIQSSIQSADRLGFGYRDFMPQKLFWVLSRISVEIAHPLRWTQTGVVETWPKDIDKLLYIRDFIARDSHEHVLARATSGWLTVDMETKRGKLIELEDPSMFFRLKDRHGLMHRPEKLGPVHGETVAEIKVSYFDLDINRHVTTTRYFDWMMDTFGHEFHRDKYPQAVSANFIKEIKPGETIRIVRNQTGANSYCFEGFNLCREITAFRGAITFTETK
ncbi:MAG: thioesterase [Lentimicrobium sp.]|uniref:acyl-[acyl-carrier-protein] thioesterase n=2 Tax=Lentimicrobium sp. TaxID=2034841 RepID=UPI0025E0BEDD|nr:acyl-ACP thioesterase domain-containing protein [Lentimicrobium sp.]MCO5257830.1 thioesterase [Lentimicrobium sp.]